MGLGRGDLVLYPFQIKKIVQRNKEVHASKLYDTKFWSKICMHAYTIINPYRLKKNIPLILWLMVKIK
jgi:hypothetical protein